MSKTIYLIGGPEDLTKRVIPNNTYPRRYEIVIMPPQSYLPAGDVKDTVVCKRGTYEFRGEVGRYGAVYIYREETYEATQGSHSD